MANSCDCIKVTSDKILSHVEENRKTIKGFKIISGDWAHKSWFPEVRLYVYFMIKSTFTKKDGTPSKPKHEHISVFFTYCPFCGKKYNEEENNSNSKQS